MISTIFQPSLGRLRLWCYWRRAWHWCTKSLRFDRQQAAFTSRGLFRAWTKLKVSGVQLRPAFFSVPPVVSWLPHVCFISSCDIISCFWHLPFNFNRFNLLDIGFLWLRNFPIILVLWHFDSGRPSVPLAAIKAICGLLDERVFGLASCFTAW